jgi:hypothetical protein
MLVGLTYLPSPMLVTPFAWLDIMKRDEHDESIDNGNFGSDSSAYEVDDARSDGSMGEAGASWVGVAAATPSSSSSRSVDNAEQGKTEEEINGEVVRARAERWRLVESVRGGIAGLAFAMAIVGVWGERY